MNENDSDQLMDSDRLRSWLKSLNVPTVVDVTKTAIPETFYVMFNGGLLPIHIAQLELIGIFCRFDDTLSGGANRYLVTYKGTK